MTSLVVRRRGTEVRDQLSVFDCHNLCHAAVANYIFCCPHGTLCSVLLCVTLPLGRSQLLKRQKKKKITKCQEINDAAKCVAIIKTTLCTKTAIIHLWSPTEQSAADDWQPTYLLFFNPYFAALFYFLEGPFMQWLDFLCQCFSQPAFVRN